MKEPFLVNRFFLPFGLIKALGFGHVKPIYKLHLFAITTAFLFTHFYSDAPTYTYYRSNNVGKSIKFIAQKYSMAEICNLVPRTSPYYQ